MANYANISASTLIKTGQGVLKGMYVNSTSSGTIKFNDGTTTTASAGVKATQTLTVSDVFTDGEVVVIGNKTYTMVDTIDNSIPNQVLIGASAAVSLDNLKSAINKSAGSGTTYSLPTDAHNQVTATTNGDTTQVVEAIAVGTAGNAIGTTTDGANASWGSTTLASGVDVNVLMNNTITPAIGWHELGGANFVNGLYATIANTLNVTLYYE